MGFTISLANPFGPPTGPKVISIEKWDDSCMAELSENTYSVVKFHYNIAGEMFRNLITPSPLSVVGEGITDMSGLKTLRGGINDLFIGLIKQEAIDTAAFNQIIGLESLRISYLNSPINSLNNSNIKKLVIDEIGKNQSRVNFSGLTKLEHIRILKGHAVHTIDLGGSSELAHVVIEKMRNLSGIILPKLARLDYVSLENIPLSIAEMIARHAPRRVELKSKDIFKTRADAERIFEGSEILW